MSAIQDALDNLNERERKLVGVLGAVVVVIVVVLPFYLMTAAISDIETENQQIADVLRDIQRARSTLAQREAEREAAAARYRTKAPPLGSFIEARAGDEELTLREVTDQPEQVIGSFRRRHVRASLPNVNLRPAIKMLTNIENSRFPVALERVQIEHFRSGDSYNVQLGVIAYERREEEAADDEDGMAARMRERGRAGPARPGSR